jgi:hypothetical protein
LQLIGRTLLILLMSGTLAGGIYFLVRSSESTTSEYGRPAFEDSGAGSRRARGGDFLERPPDYLSENRPLRNSFDGRGHDSEGRFSLGRGIFGVVRSLALISLVTFIVVRMRRNSFSQNAEVPSNRQDA